MLSEFNFFYDGILPEYENTNTNSKRRNKSLDNRDSYISISELNSHIEISDDTVSYNTGSEAE